MNPVAAALEDVEFGEPVQVANLAMVPLLRVRDERPRDYATLEEAIRRKRALVTEVSEAGSVPELRVTNTGDQPVLLMDGEELVGAKQNRTVNLTILVAAHATLDIPVTCVEAGRWRYRARHFAAAPRAHYARGRAMKAHQVSFNLARHGARHADQGAVWDDIAEKSERMAAFSESGAMAAMYEQRSADLGRIGEQLEPVARQVGAVFTINGRVTGLDLFDSADTFAALLPKLAQSYGLDAIDECVGVLGADGALGADRVRGADRAPGADGVGREHATDEAARRFLARVAAADWRPFKALGLGDDLRLEARGLSGGGLAVDGRLVHLSVFATEGTD